jgi:hypothetical protein
VLSFGFGKYKNVGASESFSLVEEFFEEELVLKLELEEVEIPLDVELSDLDFFPQ